MSEFSRLIRERRRQLNLTQEQVARSINRSFVFVSHLETGRRRPSEETMVRLIKVLGLDARESFLLANPRVQAILGPAKNNQVLSAWEQFRKNHQLRRLHKVTKGEIDMLSSVASLGEVHSRREFICILNAVRQARGR
jgi:transcriptional regulator with XRE-family HTH domain